MVEPKYEEEDEFDIGADGQVRIESIYEIREDENKVLYEVKYLDHEGEPISVLSEEELEEVR